MKNKVFLLFIFVFLTSSYEGALAKNTNPVGVADFRIATSENGQNLIYYTYGNSEFQILDDTGFITSYMMITYLLKRLVSLDVELNFKRHEAAKKELIRSLEIFVTALTKEKIAPKTIVQTKNTISTLKNMNSIVGESLLRLILDLDESLRKESGLEVRGQIKTLSSSKKNKPKWESWRDLKLPKVSDSVDLEYLP